MPEVKTKPHLHASHIDPRAYDIVERLQRKGFTTYLVGGCVRDLLLGLYPKDFDIATSATPNEIKRAVPHAYIIGRRFKLVLAKRGMDQFEIATFRREATKEELNPVAEEAAETDEPSFIFSDNFFGSPEPDALRRDFTINALFYDPITGELIDFAKGEADLKARIIRMIGDPDRRLIEDPIRSLRALRLSHKLGFSIEPELRSAIERHSPPVALAALPRRREEYLKILKLDHSSRVFFEMYDLGLIDVCWPSVKSMFESKKGRFYFRFFLDFFLREKIQQDPQPGDLMAPLVLALISYAPEKGWEWVENFLKNEFGAFKTEAAYLQMGLGNLEIFPKIENFKRRSRRRKANFFGAPWVDLQFEAMEFEHFLNAKQRMLWEREWALFKQPHLAPLEPEEPEDQSAPDPEHDQQPPKQ